MHQRLRTALATAAAAALTGGLLTVAAGPVSAAPSKLADDFNGDGYRDLAVGMSEKTINGHKRAGAILVTFGSSSGLTSKRVYVTQNTSGVPGAAETDDLFGSSLTSGDLDGDGYADLLVTSEGEGIGQLSGRGTVTVLWGGAAPFRSATTLSPSRSYDDQFFGSDTVIGDFVGDDALDVVASDGGGLWMFEGGFSRTTTARSVSVETRGRDNHLGAGRLAAGDFSGSGKDELAVTAPAATVIYAADASGFYDREVLAGGTTLAAGDLNGDARQDLAIGVPEPFPVTGGITDPSGKSGYVMVHYGNASSPGGLNTARHTYHQNTSGIPGSNEYEDQFGAALSIADVTGDGYAELAVGVPYESLGGARRGGDVLLVRGGARGVSTSGSVRFSQNTSGIPGAAENNDVFGSQVRLADFNRNGKADLAVSAPYENPYNDAGSGAIWQLHGTSSGLTPSGVDIFNPRDYGIAAGSGLGEALND